MTTSTRLKENENFQQRKTTQRPSTEVQCCQMNFLHILACAVACLVILELYMESELGNLKQKVAQLDAETREQQDLLRKCNTCSRIQHRNGITGHAPWIRNSVGDHKTCLEALTADPTLESGMFWIDPDGQGSGDGPIYVYCNMTTGSTSVLHDNEDAVDIDHCFDPGCYSRPIKYNATLRQMTVLSELSEVCQQSIQIDCFNAAFKFNGIHYAWWNDRKGDPHYFWSGNNQNTSGDGRYHTCQCGLDGTCKDKSLSCNCDSDLAIQSSDIGTLTDKDLLPVTKLNFGRTVAPASVNRHTLGRFECSGKVVLNGMPSSCQDLWRIGYTLSGLYSIKGSSSKKVETVYCDFSKEPDNQGFQTWVGYTDVKSENVYFNVQRETGYHSGNGRLLPFEKEINNVGNAFNLKSGVFVAPRNGTYVFYLSISVNSHSSLLLSLRLNDADIASCLKTSYGAWHCNIPYTLKLKPGDRVHVSVKEGSIDNAYFTGFLLSEDIFSS
ncbi:uncharacterized protein LOC124195793 isoform X1 [Daphnia pulex]|uniref:uncharacterized protein LOC124195793 isoform X1 n=1 Tax=Daphnia pulex TaxID=6669 RepID=UPI001EDE8592|nr:uncharacterized protein LOC124195793 isoform X1 [Daphnia pulex]